MRPTPSRSVTAQTHQSSGQPSLGAREGLAGSDSGLKVLCSLTDRLKTSREQCTASTQLSCL